MSDIAYLDPGSSFSEDAFRNPHLRAEVDRVDVYALTDIDPAQHRVLIVPGLIDQEYMHRQRRWIADFLDGGAVVQFSGHLFRSWLPGASHFVPRQISSHRDYLLSLPAPHPIFDGVDMAELTYRRGVAGFVARGHHPPPPGADAILTLPGGEPAIYVDQVTTRGTIVVHGGNDLIGLVDTEGSVARLVPQLLGWLRAQARTHSAVGAR